jgi:UDP-N-acetylglucosamine 2-epimerase (non-hydrolysing)
MKKIISVVGARPNFMKVAPLHKAFQKYKDSVQHLICHTGQHYDENMSKVFFDDLELPKPDFYLGIGSGSHAKQTAGIMVEFEKILLQEKPDMVIVVGDVNSTIACTLTASKLHINTAHVEAGLRSFDRDMPEEINRLLTDQISNLLFVTEKSGISNLKTEGISDNKVFFVGNVMIDSLKNYLPNATKSGILEKLSLKPHNYVLMTMHRPSNVDSQKQLMDLVHLMNSISVKRKVIFPIHPRTKKNLEDYSLINSINKEVILSEPIGYIDFLSLLRQSELVITDSGGMQEETTYLGIQCITTRSSTERPITVEIGTNHLVGDSYQKAEEKALQILNGKIKKGKIPDLWDGNSAERIVKIIIDTL